VLLRFQESKSRSPLSCRRSTPLLQRAIFNGILHCIYLSRDLQFRELRTISKAAINVLIFDDLLLPYRKRLSDAFLEQCYVEVKSICDKFSGSITSFACLISDYWSNILIEYIVNYMVTIPPRMSIFLESSQQDNIFTPRNGLQQVLNRY
jgi:hypothetical protein